MSFFPNTKNCYILNVYKIVIVIVLVGWPIMLLGIFFMLVYYSELSHALPQTMQQLKTWCVLLKDEVHV